MPHISKRKIDPKVEKYIEDSFTYLVKDLNNIEDTGNFLSSILSETERLMIAKRIVAAFLIKNNVESIRIQELLKLTPETVVRQKLWIQTHRKGFDIIFDRLEKRSQKDAIKQIFYKILAYAIKAGSGRVPNPFKKNVGEF